MVKTIYTLEEIKEKFAPIALEYGVGKVLLFGSYARKEATPDSDLDFYIVDKGRLRSLLELSGMVLDLQECFGCEIDLLSGKIEDSVLYDNIMQEGVVVYDQSR